MATVIIIYAQQTKSEALSYIDIYVYRHIYIYIYIYIYYIYKCHFSIKKCSGMHSGTKFGHWRGVLVTPMPEKKKVPKCCSGLHPEKELSEQRLEHFVTKIPLYMHMCTCVCRYVCVHACVYTYTYIYILLHVGFPWEHDLCILLYFHGNVTVWWHNNGFVSQYSRSVTMEMAM
jgi:hypothetical protein